MSSYAYAKHPGRNHSAPTSSPTPSHHAAQRMAERHIKFSEILEALATPMRCDRDADGVKVFGASASAGDLAIVLDVTQTVILTVYRSKPARWRGRNEGVSGYRRNPHDRRRDRSRRRIAAHLRPVQ